ncbi:MAG: hypothetical protein U9P88_00665, partial [Patescibacteria group bacterium]|nr:hypothetical protein [Patescibacteria group bacterium]
IEGYGAKKALPLLIIMAILVNFTPVICGVFVDASNLLMNFFLEDIEPSTFAKNQIALQKGIISEIGSPKFHIEMSVAVVASGVIFVIVDLLLIVIFLAYAVLFFIRHIAIWILVVLAPLAFTSYILPYTREWWKKWWHQFISWCLVGVIAGFFLYLSSHLMVAAGDLYSKSKIGVEGIEKEISDPETVIKVVFTILTVAILLMIGLFLTISGAPAGTQGILSAIKKNSIKFYKKAGKAGLGTGKFLSKKTPGIRNVAGGISNTAEGIGNIARTEQGIARRRETKIKEGEKAFEGLPQGIVERGLKNYNKSTFSSDRIKGEGIARTLLYGKNEQGQDYDLTDNAKKDIIALASNHPEYQKTVLSKRPDWAPEIEKGYKTKVPDNIRTTIIEQQMKKVGAKTLVKNIQKEAIHDKGVALNIIKQERLFKEFGKKDTSPEKIIELRHTLGEHTGEYRKEGHESLLDSRIHEMSENPSWLTKKETKKSTTDSNISLDTSKESFKKTKNQHKPGAFG